MAAIKYTYKVDTDGVYSTIYKEVIPNNETAVTFSQAKKELLSIIRETVKDWQCTGQRVRDTKRDDVQERQNW